MLHKMQINLPNKRIQRLTERENNSSACLSYHIVHVVTRCVFDGKKFLKIA